MMSMREITTLASIIQGEAIFDDEMPTIASVYYNRLDSNMLLQADPTIQYIIPGKPRRLFNKDLNIDNPYNTYKYKGLPPGPINNPGLAAIKATLEPKDTDYYYFVSLLRDKQYEAGDDIRRFKEAFICGGKDLQSLEREGKQWNAGETDPSNGTTFWTACINVHMGQLICNNDMITRLKL